MAVDILLKDIEWDGVNKIRVPLEGGGTQDFTIGGGITPTGNIDITQAGTTDVTNYATATVPQGEMYADHYASFITESSTRKWQLTAYASIDTGDSYGTPGYIADHTTVTTTHKYNAIPTGTSITPTTSSQTVGGANYMLEGAITVDAIPSQYIIPSGTTKLTANTITGLGYLVKTYERAVVDVCIEFNVANDYTVLCNRTWQGCYNAITDDAYDAIVKYNNVTYGASAYGLDTNTGELHFVVFQTPTNGTCLPLFDIYYPYTGDPYYVSPSHILGTEGTPTATKSAVTNHAIAVTPSVTNTGGYINGGTHTGAAVNITAGELVSGSETKTINGTYDVSNLATLVVDVNPSLQTKTKTYTPSSYQQEEIISADAGYDGLLAVAVTVERISGLTLPVGPSLSYTGTRKAKIYQSNSTQYWNIGVGYHNSAEYYEVPPLLVDTKTITQNGTYYAIDDDLDGYSSVTVNVSGGSPTLQTKSVTYTPTTSQQTAQITADNGYDGLQEVDITVNAMTAGSVTAPSTIEATGATINPTLSTTTLTVQKSNVSVTPSVTQAGYISSGTAGDSTVVVGTNIPTKQAATYYPSTSDQTIASNNFIMGTQTFKAVTMTNLTAANIKQGVTVEIGDADDPDRIASIVGTYSGGGASNFVLLGSKDCGTVSTSSTTAATINKDFTVSGVQDYDLLVVETSVATKVNNRHASTSRLIWLSNSSNISTKNSSAIANVTWNCKLSSTGVGTTRTSTTPRGVYPNSCSVSTTNGVTTASIVMYSCYNSTQTGTINGTYTARVYGVKLYDLIGG